MTFRPNHYDQPLLICLSQNFDWAVAATTHLGWSEVRTILEKSGHEIHFIENMESLQNIVTLNKNRPIIMIVDSFVNATIDTLKSYSKLTYDIILLTEHIPPECVADLFSFIRFTVNPKIKKIAQVLLSAAIQKIVSNDIFGPEKYCLSETSIVQFGLTEAAKRYEILELFQKHIDSAHNLIPIGSSEFTRKACEVLEELLMNACWDANPQQVCPPGPVIACWAVEDGTLILSVKDRFGTFRKETLLKYQEDVQGQHSNKSFEVNKIGRGAGIGLHMILRRVSGLVINLEPNKFTEFIALIDISQSPKNLEKGHKQLHFFTV